MEALRQIHLSIPFLGFPEISIITSIINDIVQLSIPFLGFMAVDRRDVFARAVFQFHSWDSELEKRASEKEQVIGGLSIPFLGFLAYELSREWFRRLQLSIPFLGF